jgi:MATE family multidrug resistance protein
MSDHAPLHPTPGSVSPLRELMSLALPTIFQMASYTLLQFADTFMIADYGERFGAGPVEPTAAANAGFFSFAVISFGVGTLFVVNALVSQNFGQRDYRNCGRYLWQGVWFALLFSLLTIPALLFPAAPFRWFGHDAALIALEAQYLQITLSFTAVKLVGTAFSQFLLAIDRPMQVLIASLVAVVVNLLANWVLIYGHLGLPAMGVAGAAWGTNLAVTIETLILVGFAVRPSVRRVFNTFDWRWRAREMATLLRVGIPSGVQIVADVLAWSLFSVWVIAVFGTIAMAANGFMFQYMKVSFMPAFGLATAVTALVGRYIGMGRPDLAEQRAHLGFKVCVAYMLSCGVFFLVGGSDLIRVFSDDPEVVRMGAVLLVFAAVYQLFDAVYIVYNGALRGAGDTFVPAVATAVLCWGITVFGGFAIAKLFPQWGVYGPWVAATVYGVILGVFMYARFARGQWKLIRLEHDSHPATMPPPEIVTPDASPELVKTP